MNYEGTRIDRGSSTFYIVPTPDELAGRFSTTIIDPLTGQPFPNNTIPHVALLAPRPAGDPERVVPRPEHQRAPGQLPAGPDASPDAEPVHRAPRPGPGPVRTGVRPLHEDDVREHVQRVGDPGGRRQPLRAGHEELAGLPHLAHQEQRRQRVPGRPRGSPGQPGGNRLLPGGRRLPRLDGRLHEHPRRRRGDVPGVGMQGYARRGRGRQRLHGQQSTHVGRQQHDHVGHGQSHPQLRRELPPVVAPARHWPPTSSATSGTSTSASPATRSRTSCSATTAGASVFQPGPFSSAGAVGNPHEFNWMYFAPYIQDDWKVSSKLTLNLGLRYDYRNVPYETNDHMAWRNLDYAPGGLLVADETPGERGNRRRRLLPGGRATQSREPRPVQGLRSPDRLRLPSHRVREHGHPGRLRDLLRLRRATRDRRRRGCLSVRQPRKLHAEPRPDGAAPDDGPALPELHRRRSGDARSPTPSSR